MCIRDSISTEEQDREDAEDLYSTLENEIIPLYYSLRSQDNLPGDWIAMVKESIRTLAPQFSMRRMVKEYINELYLPAMEAEQETQPVLE
jgi:starch phosphorylase